MNYVSAETLKMKQYEHEALMFNMVNYTSEPNTAKQLYEWEIPKFCLGCGCEELITKIKNPYYTGSKQYSIHIKCANCGKTNTSGLMDINE